MLLVTGALVAGYLGYKLFGWWAPGAVAVAVLAAQAIAYQGVLSGSGGRSEYLQILLLSGAMSVMMFYATFSIGRSLGRWRRGVR